MQEIQFLEFMGGSNLPQAFPNYLICLRFIRISTVRNKTIRFVRMCQMRMMKVRSKMRLNVQCVTWGARVVSGFAVTIVTFGIIPTELMSIQNIFQILFTVQAVSSSSINPNHLADIFSLFTL